MKKLLCALAMLLLITGLRFSAAAQGTSATPEEIIATSAMSRNIVRLIGSLSREFATVKGELLTKLGDSILVYNVNDMSSMGADNQYIMFQKNGKAYYIASFASDVKQLNASFAAFITGVTTVTNAEAGYAIAQDKALSTEEKLVYTISSKGARVGSYTMETTKKEGTLIIGFL